MPKSLKIIFAFWVCLQFVMLCVIFLVDFGFFFPGPHGSLKGLMMWAQAYIVILLLGLVLAFVARSVRLTVLQIALPLLFTVGTWIYSEIPKPYFDAAKHQHLVGKSREEVVTILGKKRYLTSGFERRSNGDDQYIDFEFESYRGMTILYSRDGIVMEVEPDQD